MTATVVVAAVGLAASAGGAAGWFAGRAAVPSPAPTTTVHRGPSAGAASFDVADVLAVVEPSIAAIHTRVAYEDGFVTRSRPEAGTGIVLSADGLVLTNAHVVDEALSISVSLPGHDDVHDGALVDSDSFTDVAVVRVEGVDGLVPATFGDSDQVEVGADVVAVGNALDLGQTMTVTRGIISARGREIDTDHGTFSGLLQTDAAMSSGVSGGALIDSTGAVIAMNSAVALGGGATTAQNIGFAIPSNVILEVIAHFGLESR